MTDFLDEKRQEITDRLRELKSAVDEYNRLEAAALALAGVPSSPSASTTPRRRGSGRTRGSGTRAKIAGTTTVTKARGKREGSGTRAAQALSLVQSQPGITIQSWRQRWASSRTTSIESCPPLRREAE